MRVAALLIFRRRGFVECSGCGCGDGRWTVLLQPICTIDGIDLSQDAGGARGRGCYRDLSVCDMSKPLGAVVDGKYDVTSCGTLVPSLNQVSSPICMITAPGLVCFTHRTDKVDEWGNQSRL